MDESSTGEPSRHCATCGTGITPLGPNRIWREMHPGEDYLPREWVDALNNKASAEPVWHEHAPSNTSLDTTIKEQPMPIVTDMTRTAETLAVGDVVRDDESWDWITVAQINPVSDRDQNGSLMVEPHITFGGQREKHRDTVIRSWPAAANIITRSDSRNAPEQSTRRLCAYPNDTEGEHDHSECLDAGGRPEDLHLA